MVSVSWKPVFGADGYKIMLYMADDANTCIKTRYSQKCSKSVTGLVNGKEYLVQICAFYYNKNGTEVFGELSQKLSFIPVCNTLKAKPLLLKQGQTAKLECGYRGSLSQLRFSSEDDSIASVSPDGTVTAKSEGTCKIKIVSPEGEISKTKAVIGRRQGEAHGRAVLMFTGDIMCTSKQQRDAEPRLYDFFSEFDGVRDMLSEADFSAGTLDPLCFDEYPYEHEQKRVNGSDIFSNAPSSFISAVAGAGFSGVSTSTDKSLTLGQDALDATARFVRGSGLKNFGTMGDNPTVVNVRGFKVGIIAVTMITSGSEENSLFNFNAKYDREYFVELVNRARSMDAEYIAVLVHWGKYGTRKIKNSQIKEARFMAESGADLVVGCHSHIVQKFEFINTGDGRRVPCAYSLGNFISGQSEMHEFQDGAVLRVELSRNGENVNADISYIPCASEDGLRVVCAKPSHNEFTKESARRTALNIGSLIKPYAKKPKVTIIGSSILYRILTAGEGFRVDTAGLYLSALTLGSAKSGSAPEGSDRTVALDIEKDIKGYFEKSGTDYLALDFYTAASIAVYKESGENGDSYYSNTKKLRGSEFYAVCRDNWVRIRPPFGERIWKPLVRGFAKKLKEALPSRKIVLFRSCVSARQKSGVQLRTVPENERRNRFIREMEDYFIALVHPVVVDLADKYFVEDGSQITFEPEFYRDSYNALREIVSGSGRTYIDSAGKNPRFNRIMKYYDSMSLRQYHKRFLNLGDAADKIIAQTSVDFCARNSERILKLKDSGVSELLSVAEFFANDAGASEMIRASEIINAVEKGNLSHPYDYYAPAFEGKYNIVKSIARQLSKEYGVTVNEDSAELMFLLRGKPQLKRYVNSLYQFTADIWGSDISREAMNLCRGAHIGKYICMQAPILYREKEVEVTFPESEDAFCGNKWRRRITKDAFTRNGMDQLNDSEAPWLIVDFYDLICTLADYHGALFQIDDFMRRTDFYKSIKAECADCYLFEKRDMKYCFEQITRFSNDVSELYGDNIILIKADPKNVCINTDYRLEKMGNNDMFEFKQRFISLCEERFASVTKCYVIDISKNFYSSDMYPLGGRHIAHYEDEFYRQTAEYIRSIFLGSEQKLFKEVDENYILLRDLKLKRD